MSFSAHIVGVFLEHIDCGFAHIYHRTYVHQKYVRLLVTDIYAHRKDTNFEGIIYLKYANLTSTKDIVWGQEQNYYGNK